MSETNSQAEASPSVDVDIKQVAKVYAEALLDAADKQNLLDSTLEEFDSLLTDVFHTDPRLEVLFSSRAIGRVARAEVIRKVFAGRASDVFLHFMLVLSEHERLDLLRPIFSEFKELYDHKRRRMRVFVESAAPLPDDQKKRLENGLRESLQIEPILVHEVQPDLIGGMRIRIGDWQYDGSLKTRIETIRNQIMARSSYEIQSRRDRFSSDTGNRTV